MKNFWCWLLSFFVKPAYKKYGWIPDKPDHRDYIFQEALSVEMLPTMVDMRKDCPAVYDQSSLGSCTANATAAQCEIEAKQNKKPIYTPSRLFVYYNSRLLEGTTRYDSGASIRDSVKTILQYGYCRETAYPYVISKFRSKPSASLYAAAAEHKITTKQYARVSQTLTSLKSCLALGNTVNFGFTVYSSFESDAVAKTGIMPMPKKNERSLGGHAVLMVGYDDAKQCFIVRNSWSARWGDKGYFYMPYAFAVNSSYASDFWTITNVNS